MSDMLGYRIGMLKSLNTNLQGRCHDMGIVYHPATFYEIRGLAEVSLEVCPNRHEFAFWKEHYTGTAFPTIAQFKQEFSKEHAARMIEEMKARLAKNVSAQKHAADAYEATARPRAARGE